MTVKYLLNGKLAKYPKNKENENEQDNIGYYFINKTPWQSKMSNAKPKCVTWKSIKNFEAYSLLFYKVIITAQVKMAEL